MRFFFFLVILLIGCFQQLFSNIVVINGLTHIHSGIVGSTISGTIQLRNDGNMDERFIIYQRDLLLSCSQNFDYKPLGSHSHSLGGWLKTNVDEKILKPQEVFDVTYTISIPKNIPEIGTYWDIIMVEIGEPLKEKSNEGISIESKVRYAVQIISDIGIKESPKLIFDKVEFLKVDKEEKKQSINVRLKNEGKFLAMTKLNLEIFNNVGEKIKVINGFQKKVYPGYCTDFDIELKDVPKGKYDGVLVADNGKDLYGENVTIIID